MRSIPCKAAEQYSFACASMSFDEDEFGFWLMFGFIDKENITENLIADLSPYIEFLFNR